MQLSIIICICVILYAKRYSFENSDKLNKYLFQDSVTNLVEICDKKN
jgi:hypothetical protein